MARSSTATEPMFGTASMPTDAIWLSNRGLWAGHELLVDHSASEPGLRRLEGMLAIAFRRQLSKRCLQAIGASIEVSRSGDQALANLRLAFGRLPRMPSADDWPARAVVAKSLLAKARSIEELLQLVEADRGLYKYDPNQPRVPAGSGSESGRWTNNSGGEQASASAIPAVAAMTVRNAPLFASSVGAETLAALSTFAASVGFAAALGFLFVPSPNTTSSCGPLPGDTENTYSYDHDEGLLRVLGPSGVVLAAGQKDSSGVFHDENTGVPFAREVNGVLLFDGDDINDRTEQSASTDTGENDKQDPKLCPEPGLDQPGSSSAKPRARAYQEQISFMTNPQRPLPFGLAMNLVNPVTGNVVHYDECDEQSGTMIEAKGPGFDGVLSFPKGFENVTHQWLDQGTRELQAAGTRDVVWYFAEDYAADQARQLFARNGLDKIIVKVQHPV